MHPFEKKELCPLAEPSSFYVSLLCIPMVLSHHLSHLSQYTMLSEYMDGILIRIHLSHRDEAVCSLCVFSASSMVPSIKYSHDKCLSKIKGMEEWRKELNGVSVCCLQCRAGIWAIRRPGNHSIRSPVTVLSKVGVIKPSSPSTAVWRCNICSKETISTVVCNYLLSPPSYHEVYPAYARQKLSSIICPTFLHRSQPFDQLVSKFLYHGNFLCFLSEGNPNWILASGSPASFPSVILSYLTGFQVQGDWRLLFSQFWRITCLGSLHFLY